MDVRERDSAGPPQEPDLGGREWVTIVGNDEPRNGLADRSRNWGLAARRFQEQSRLHWPNGVPANGNSRPGNRFDRNWRTLDESEHRWPIRRLGWAIGAPMPVA